MMCLYYCCCHPSMPKVKQEKEQETNWFKRIVAMKVCIHIFDMYRFKIINCNSFYGKKILKHMKYYARSTRTCMFKTLTFLIKGEMQFMLLFCFLY